MIWAWIAWMYMMGYQDRVWSDTEQSIWNAWVDQLKIRDEYPTYLDVLRERIKFTYQLGIIESDVMWQVGHSEPLDQIVHQEELFEYA